MADTKNDQGASTKLTKINEGGDEDDVGEADDGKIQLKKSITLFNGITILVGCIIGSGIFISPAGVQRLLLSGLYATSSGIFISLAGVRRQTGSPGMALIVWVVCGVFSAVGAYCYAELGTLIRKTGGDYAYIMEAFGPFLAFVRLWIESIVVRPCTAAVVALTFAVYMLRPIFPHCQHPDLVPQLLAASLLIILTFINCVSVKLATKIQDLFTIAKLVALVLIIITGIVLICTGKPQYTENFENIFEGTSMNIGDWSIAFYSGLFAYQGWNYLNFVVEEVQNPRRNLPLAIAISCATVTVVYVLTNVALLTVISPDEMLSSPAVAVEFANKLYGPFALCMPLFVACSTVGSANGVILTSSRLFYAGAREGHMPNFLIMIHETRYTPIPAVLFTGLLSLCYLLMSKNIFVLINYISIVYWVATGVTILSLVWMRRSIPNAPRPIKVNLIWPLIFLAGCIFLVVVPMYAAPLDSIIGLSLMLTSVPVYLLFIKPKTLPQFIINTENSFTRLIQKLFVVVAEDKSD